jgi:hypothetical protein
MAAAYPCPDQCKNKLNRQEVAGQENESYERENFGDMLARGIQ